jgi:subtilisin-like proprotein convertase family protein
MKKIYQIVLASLILVSTTTISAQSNTSNYWTKSSKAAVTNIGKVNRNAQPSSSQIFNLDFNTFKTALVGAPVRGQSTAKSNVFMDFPTADGKLEKYRVMESPIMEAPLAASLPMIKTYVAQGIDDPTAYMRFSITQFGLHTMSLSGKRSTTYIDPYTTDLSSYIIYDRNSLGADPQPFECLTPQDETLPSLKQSNLSDIEAVDDQKFRTFRLAQTCNAEYGNIFATTPGNEFNDIMAQMTITVNRVNSVYEVDLGVTLIFIANQAALVFWGATGSDPWTGEFNTTTQNFLNSTLANGDYDIGHNFNTSGGGNAGCIGCVCVNGQKGSGMTGRSNPTGDPFDIDYVAHEYGHQFGGYHTMNDCSRSGSGLTEVEPASGSSIMGYAGICGTNVQGNSDAHFNYVNVRDISANIKPGGTSTCASELTTTNNPPTADAGFDYTIPRSTAFILEGSATDADGLGSLTYEWSQNDPAQAPGSTAPQSTWTVGPLYRAKMPIASPDRYMPRLQDVIAGNLTPTWEVTPSVARTMNFSFMVRDNDIQGGQTADDLMQVTVDGNSGPFTVTSQTTAVTWNEGASETVTWNVANTTAAPVSTPNVDIFLSIDGGFTYPYTIASNVPNNGTATVTVPTGIPTSIARVMVRGAGNIFYALNSTNFTVTASEFVMNFSPGAAAQNVCAPGNATYNFTYNTFLGFTDITTFSASGNPAGTTVTFSPTTAQTNGTPVTMTISGITPAMVGNYAVTVTGTAASATKNTNVSLDVYSSTFSPTTLSTPTNGAQSLIGPYLFNWVANANATSYNIDIATDAGFATIVDNGTGIATNSYSTNSLAANTVHYWRVIPVNQCGSGSASSSFMFTTSNCLTTASTDVPVSISASGTPTVTSTLNIPFSGSINDLNVLNLTGQHTYISDLIITLASPQGTNVTLMNTICNNENDFDVNYDDAAPVGALPCPPVGGGTYQPDSPLSAFNGENPQGIWTLTIEDVFNQDGGSLDSWELDICINSTVTSISEKPESGSISIYPNPTNDFISIDISNFVGVEKLILNDMRGRIVYQSDQINENIIKIDLKNLNKGIYMLRVESTSESQVYKVIKN